MAYQPLTLPSGLSPDIELACKQLELLLADAHTMLRLPVPSEGLMAGCNLSVAQVLLSVVSGASVTIYERAISERGDRTRLFNEFVTKYYPWEQEQHIPGARIEDDAAKELYKFFRNPLAHAAGIIDPVDNPDGRRVMVEKGSIAENVIVADERSATRPSDADGEKPTLRADKSDPKCTILWVRGFYWGVRKMIERVVADRAGSAAGTIASAPLKVADWRTT